LFIISPNGKSIGEERATLQTFSKKTDLEQKLFLPTKLIKNRRVVKVFVCIIKIVLKESIHPVFRQYNVELNLR
jgi:hypothetical protein